MHRLTYLQGQADGERERRRCVGSKRKEDPEKEDMEGKKKKMQFYLQETESRAGIFHLLAMTCFCSLCRFRFVTFGFLCNLYSHRCTLSLFVKAGMHALCMCVLFAAHECARFSVSIFFLAFLLLRLKGHKSYKAQCNTHTHTHTPPCQVYSCYLSHNCLKERSDTMGTKKDFFFLRVKCLFFKFSLMSLSYSINIV